MKRIVSLPFHSLTRHDLLSKEGVDSRVFHQDLEEGWEEG